MDVRVVVLGLLLGMALPLLAAAAALPGTPVTVLRRATGTVPTAAGRYGPYSGAVQTEEVWQRIFPVDAPPVDFARETALLYMLGPSQFGTVTPRITEISEADGLIRAHAAIGYAAGGEDATGYRSYALAVISKTDLRVEFVSPPEKAQAYPVQRTYQGILADPPGTHVRTIVRDQATFKRLWQDTLKLADPMPAVNFRAHVVAIITNADTPRIEVAEVLPHQAIIIHTDVLDTSFHHPETPLVDAPRAYTVLVLPASDAPFIIQASITPCR